MPGRQTAQRGRSSNDSGRRNKAAAGGVKQRAGASGGKHPKNKTFTGGATSPRQQRHRGAKPSN